MKIFNLLGLAIATLTMLGGCDKPYEPGTDEPEAPKPAEVTVKEGTAGETSLTFSLVPQNATKVLYLCLPKAEPQPELENLMEDGMNADATSEKEYTVTGLQPYTAYVISAVAANESGNSEIKRIEMTTSVPVHTVEVALGEVKANSCSFTVTTTNAKEAAWICLPKAEDVPDAAKVFADGTGIAPNESVEASASTLQPNTEYIIVAAVKNLAGESAKVSEPVYVTTLELPKPKVGDFYYSDGTWSTELDGSKTPIAIVFYTGVASDYKDAAGMYKRKDGVTKFDDILGYAVAITDATFVDGENLEVAWSFFDGGYGGAGCSSQLEDFSGYTNTLAIKNAANERPGELTPNDDSFPAAYYAAVAYEEACPAPESSSGWFLPSAYQFKYIYDNVYFNEEGILNAWLENSFETLGDKAQPLYARDAEYWTSTEQYDSSGCSYKAYYFCFDSSMYDPGFIANYNKHVGFRVRSMLAF